MINKIIEYNKSGLTFDEISIKLNYSVVSIKRLLKKNNIKLKNNLKFKTYVNVDKIELEKLYKDNILIKEISNYFNCSINTIRLKLKEYNIELNTNKIYFQPKKGDKFNRLTFLNELNTINNKKHWLCECECGIIKSYDYYNIIKGDVKSCGCYHKDNVKNYNWTGYKDIPGRYWSVITSGAIKRNIDFLISIEYAWSIYEKQNRKCKLSNLPIDFETKNHKIKTFQASLDRIDNSKGYIVGNIQWIVKEINYMKNKIEESKFLYLCKKINDYNE
jgi:hypothetical protein